MPNEETANPAPLGLAGFGLTTVLLNIINAGLVPIESVGIILPMGLFYGGLAQLAAGMWVFKKGNTFGATAFSSFGCFWFAFAFILLFESLGIIQPVPVEGLAIFLVGWGIFTGYMTIGTFRISVALQVIFITLTILFFLLAIGQFVPIVHTIAGWEGIFCGFSALYTSAGTVINETWGRNVVPLGHVKKK